MKITWKTKTEQCSYQDLQKGDKIIIANNVNIVTKTEKDSLGFFKIYAEAHTEYGVFEGINIEGPGGSLITRIIE
jgi:hypothetical protein